MRGPQDGTPAFGHVLLYCDRQGTTAKPRCGMACAARTYCVHDTQPDGATKPTYRKGAALFVVKTSLDVLYDINIGDLADTFIKQPRELLVKGFNRSGTIVSLGPRSELIPGYVTQSAANIPGPGAGVIHIGDTWQGVTASLVQPPPFLLCRRARVGAPPPRPRWRDH